MRLYSYFRLSMGCYETIDQQTAEPPEPVEPVEPSEPPEPAESLIFGKKTVMK